jgi:CRP/FNR family transcriptional regulator, cyclic AMP receptor protein
VSDSSLGRVYRDGETVVRQGEVSEGMFVIQEGTVEVVVEKDGQQVFLRTLGKGEFIGEMGIFERLPRSATVRARGDARLLSVDRKTFLRRIHEDPSLAFRVVETLSRRVRDLSDELARLQVGARPGSPRGNDAV